jgi:hypothetical protein
MENQNRNFSIYYMGFFLLLNERNFMTFDSDLYKDISGYDNESSSFLLSSTSSFSVLPFYKAFSVLEEKMKEGLSSLLKPAFYILSADAGSGKSTTVHKFIRQWKSEGFWGDGSIIVFLATFNEIDSYIHGCGLAEGDYACISSDEKYNGYGLGRHRAGKAKILFTTHEQARRRIAEMGGFEAADLFYYRGRPRPLRLWDEGLDAARPVTFSLNSLDALPAALSGVKGGRKLIAALRPLRLAEEQLKVGFTFTIPPELGELAGNMALNLKGAVVPQYVIKTLEGLSALAGQPAILREDSREGFVFVGIGQPLPDDLAPLIVLDASARLRPSYRYWADRCSNVISLPPATADYSSMELHWWNKGAGKSVLANPVERECIVAAAADLLNSNDEEWLVIHQKAVQPYATRPAYCVASEIRGRLHNEGRVTFVHWGRHLASNEHRHIRNVLIIGGNHYPQQSYEAIYAAAAGRLDNINDQAVRHISAFEFAHHVYQAACRSNLRNMDHETAGQAKVFLICSNAAGKRQAIEQAFPNCAVHDWTPVPRKRTKKEQKVIDAIASLFGSDDGQITLKALIDACGGKDSQYLREIWGRPAVIKFMSKYGISRTKKYLIRQGSSALKARASEAF